MIESLIALLLFVIVVGWLGLHPEFGCPPRRPYDEPGSRLSGWTDLPDIAALKTRVDWPLGIAEYMTRQTYLNYRVRGLR